MPATDRHDGRVCRRTVARRLRQNLAPWLIVLTVGFSMAQGSPEGDRAPTTVTMLCVDSDGQPVAGAEVHLFQHRKFADKRYDHFGPFTSDQQGRVTCREALFTDEHGCFDRWVYARVPGELVGLARSAQWKDRPVVNGEFRVSLRPSRTVEGQVSMPAGVDPTLVTVRVVYMQIITGANLLDYQGFPRYAPFYGLDTALAEQFDRHPDAAGHVRFDDVPARGHLYLATVATGMGEAQWRNATDNFDQPIDITVEPESTMAGRVITPDLQPVAGAEVSVRLQSEGGQNGIFHESTFQAIADERGRFAIHGLPQRRIALSIDDPRHEFAFRPRDLRLPLDDEARQRLLTMETAIVVSGRVLDPQGQPVAGAGLSAVTDDMNGYGLSDGLTDDAGRYRLHLPGGKARMYFNSLPAGFECPKPQMVKDLDIKPGQAAVSDLSFTLERSKPDAPAEPEAPEE